MKRMDNASKFVSRMYTEIEHEIFAKEVISTYIFYCNWQMGVPTQIKKLRYEDEGMSS